LIMIVIRINNQNQFIHSKPCNVCESKISKIKNIKTVYYS